MATTLNNEQYATYTSKETTDMTTSGTRSEDSLVSDCETFYADQLKGKNNLDEKILRAIVEDAEQSLAEFDASTEGDLPPLESQPRVVRVGVPTMLKTMRRQRPRSQGPTFLVLLVLACFCASPIPAIVRPTWVDSHPSDPEMYVGIGFAAVGRGDKAAARDAADANARKNLAQEISVNIQGELEIYAHDAKTHGASSSLEAIKERTTVVVDQSIEGASISSRWYNEQKQEWYSLAVVGRDEFRQNLKRRLQEKQDQERVLPDAVAAALAELAQKAVAPGKSVLLYNITYEDQGLPSSMGRYIENLALTSATSAHLFTIYSRAKFDAAVKAKGASIGDLKGEPVDFVLSGMFFLSDEGLRVFLKVAAASDGDERAHTTFKIDRRSLPAGIDITPPNRTEAANASLASLLPQGSHAGLRVVVFPDRGKGGAYWDGDQMVIVVKANKDCFVKVFMTTADGKTVLIFPNRYDLNNRLPAGRARLLGTEGDPFKFNITKPYGLETLKAIASTEQFRDYDQIAITLKSGTTFDMITLENRDTVTKYMTRGIAINNDTGAAQLAEDGSAYSALPSR